MEYVIFAALYLGAMMFGSWLVYQALESYSLVSVWSLSAFAFWSIIIGICIGAIVETEKKGPCVKYETQMHCNAAVKQMMPARVCVLRGVWEDAQ